MPDWPDNFNNLFFLISIIGTANLFDVVCLFPNESKIFYYFKKIKIINKAFLHEYQIKLLSLFIILFFSILLLLIVTLF